ncbi:MAG TPA: aromatic ring-hydroxylating dioxygenase subunit alpha [Ferrovibrio sp.]|uniref:aromatic ring-hydroxylating oxygenase subunit alpha n=1 Tax=Ferrovibrio sp. TaxID=1917215 RepID=UPI002ED20046
MDYAPHLAQCRRLLALMQDDGDVLPAEVFHMTPDVYWRPEHFALERERLFFRAPLVLGHAALLPRPGDTLVLDVLGQPLLLVRGRDRQIRGFLNVCRHRGTRLCNAKEGEGGEVLHRTNFTCRYHNWVYDLDGRLKHVPLEDAFPGLDRAAYGLTRIPLAVREGVIFGMIDPDATMDIDGFLAGIDGDLAAHGFGGMHVYARRLARRKANWKLIMDAFLESYHVVRLHQSTIAPFFMDKMAVMDRLGPHQRSLLARQEFVELADLPEAAWDGRRHCTFAYAIFPNTILVLSPDYTSMLTMYPEAADQTLYCHTMLTPHAPRDAKEDDHWRRSLELIEGGVFQAEDLFIAEQAQIGMASGANKTMVYGRFEASIRSFHESVDEWTGARSVVETR